MRIFKNLTASVTTAALALAGVPALADDGRTPETPSALSDNWIFVPVLQASAEPPALDCSPITEDAYTNPRHSDLMNEMKSYLWYTPTGRTLLSEAQTGRQGPTEVCFAYFLGTAAGLYSPSANRIVMEDQGPGTLGIFAHELSHRFTKATGDAVHHFMEHDDNSYLATFAGEAFAEATKLKVLWELRDQGYTQFWDNALVCQPQQFEMTALCYDDITRRYEEARATGGDAQAAHLAAFNAWFSMPRINSYVETRQARAREALSTGRVDLRSAWTWGQEGCTLPAVNNRVRRSMLPYMIAPAENTLASEERLAMLDNLDNAFLQAGRFMLLKEQSCSADDYMQLFTNQPQATNSSSAASAHVQP
ncbi:MAG: DUF6782 family putative metallopeptidase [Pseudobdellovibrionaceae bacterium]